MYQHKKSGVSKRSESGSCLCDLCLQFGCDCTATGRSINCLCDECDCGSDAFLTNYRNRRQHAYSS